MDEEELMDLEPEQVVDARGSACPGPLLEAKKGIASVPVGGVLEIRSSDEATRKDIPIWSGKVGHEFLGFLAADEGYDRSFVKRGK